MNVAVEIAVADDATPLGTLEFRLGNVSTFPVSFVGLYKGTRGIYNSYGIDIVIHLRHQYHL